MLKRNDQTNPFYETMREVAPCDVVYSFADDAPEIHRLLNKLRE